MIDDNDKPQWQHIADLTSKIVMAYLEKANPPVPIEDLPKLIGRVREELTGRAPKAKTIAQIEDEMRGEILDHVSPRTTKQIMTMRGQDEFDAAAPNIEPNGHHPEPEHKPLTPAVPVANSVTHDHIFCLEDGCRMRILKGHLMSAHKMTPEEYRKKWSLPRDYPMTAPSYSARRKEIAAGFGLGKQVIGGRKRAREEVR